MTYCVADYSNPVHARAVTEMVNCLAMDPVGQGRPLPAEILQALVPALARYPNCFSILSMDGDTGVGLSLCFESLSSFKARPIVNIHDFVVRQGYRGQGIARRLIEETEKEARRRDACKMTLEVLEGNRSAQRLYERCGFSGYELDPANGKALFWEKALV